jgi:hypothetical protein
LLSLRFLRFPLWPRPLALHRFASAKQIRQKAGLATAVRLGRRNRSRGNARPARLDKVHHVRRKQAIPLRLAGAIKKSH